MINVYNKSTQIPGGISIARHFILIVSQEIQWLTGEVFRGPPRLLSKQSQRYTGVTSPIFQRWGLFPCNTELHPRGKTNFQIKTNNSYIMWLCIPYRKYMYITLNIEVKSHGCCGVLSNRLFGGWFESVYTLTMKNHDSSTDMIILSDNGTYAYMHWWLLFGHITVDHTYQWWRSRFHPRIST